MGKTGVYNVNNASLSPIDHMTRFDLATKTIFLTYSQLTENGRRAFFERANAHFDFITHTLRRPTVYRLSRESHEDGGIHAHCYIAWSTPIRLRSERKLDFGESHPNIQSVRSGHRRTWEYTGKDGDIIYEHGDPPLPTGSPPGRDNSIWDQIVSSPSKEEFYNNVRRLAPRYFVLYQTALDTYAEKHYPEPREEYRGPLFDDLSDDRLRQWVRDGALGSGSSGHRRRSLILWGPTRTGKTVWARSLHKYVIAGETPADPPHTILNLVT